MWSALAARANTWPTTTSFYPLFKVLDHHKLAHGHGGMGEASSRPSQLTRSKKRELDYLLQLCSNVGIIAQETCGNSSNALAPRTLPEFQGGPRMRVSTSTATLEGCMTFGRNSVIGRMLNVVRFELCRGRDHCLSLFHAARGVHGRIEPHLCSHIFLHLCWSGNVRVLCWFPVFPE